MARKHRRRSITGDHTAASLFLTVLCIFAADGVQAQSPPNGRNSSNHNNFTSAKLSPSIAVIIIVLFSVFFFLGIFAFYIHKCGGDRMGSLAAAVRARSRRQRGLDSGILETFPTLVYSEVMDHKIGKGALECAICINEFEDEDAIRLLPKCDHVFHIECIDAWLATHVTCPVCRANYDVDAAAAEGETDLPAAAESVPIPDPPAAATDQVVIAVDDEERKQEMLELARIASRVRRNGSRRGWAIPRSNSTGHSITQQGNDLDRYTLRLPENVRKDIIAAVMLQRRRSLAAARGGGEDSIRRGRSIRLGQLDRWPSFIVHSVSETIPAWGNWKRVEKCSVEEGSMMGEFAGGGFSKKNPADSESSAATLTRI